MRRSTVLALVLSTLATLALGGCASGWSPPEEAEVIIAQTSPAPVDLSLEWRKSDMSASAAAQLARAALILDDGAAALIDYHTRIDRAVTPEEKQALTQKRVHRLEAMVAQVDELRHVVQLAEEHASASSIAIVFTAVAPEPASHGVAAAPPIGTELELDHVAILGPREVPAGPSYRTASLRLALTALVDVMENQAEAEGILRPETKEKLAKQ
jgi:hypothetical protein